MADLKVALKLTADAADLLSGVDAARADLTKLKGAANEAGDSLRGATGGANVSQLDQARRVTRGLGDDMATAAERARSLQRAAADAAASERQAAGGAGEHAAALRLFGGAAGAANDNVLSLRGALGLLSGGLKALGGLFAVDKLLEYGGHLVEVAAQAQQLERRLASLLGTGQALADNQTWLAQTADKLGQNQIALTDSYARLLTLAKGGLVTVQQARDLTTGLSDAQVKFAADSARMGDVMYGLGQALASPILHMEELNQVTEPLPGLLLDLDRAAGLPSGGFRKLVNDGRVTADMFRDTLLKALKGYAGEAEKAAGSVEGSLQRMENAKKRFEAEMGKRLLPSWTAAYEFGADVFTWLNGVAASNAKQDDQTALSMQQVLLDQLIAKRTELEGLLKEEQAGGWGPLSSAFAGRTQDQLSALEGRIDSAFAKVRSLQDAVNGTADAWTAVWGAYGGIDVDPAAVALDKLRGRLDAAADGAGLVVTKTGLLSKSEIELGTATDTLTKVMALPPDQLKKLGISAADAAVILQQLQEKLDPVAAAVAALNRETAALGVAPRFRGLYQALDKAEQEKGRPLRDDEAADVSISYSRNRTANSAEQVRLTREAADAADALAKAQASGDPIAQANARANLKVAEALRDGVIVQADKAGYRQQVLRQEMAQLTGQAGEAATVSSRQARQTLELAEATRQGGAAIAETTLRQQIENETLKVGAGSHSELAKRLTEEAAARRELAAAQFDRDLDTQIAAAKALAEAETKGSAAVADATLKNQVAAEVEKEGVATDGERAKSIAGKTAELAKWQQQQQLNRAVAALDRELQLMQAELSLQGVGEAQRQRILDLLQYELEIRDQFPAMAEADIQALLRKKAALLDAQDLKRFQADVRSTSQSIANDLAQKMFDKGGSILDWWHNLLKRMAIEIASTKFIMPIVQTVVSAVPSLFGVEAPAGTSGSTSTGVGSALSLSKLGDLFSDPYAKGGAWLDKTFPSLFSPAALNTGQVAQQAAQIGTGARELASGAMPLDNGGSLPFSGAQFLQGAGAALNLFNAFSSFGQGRIGSGVGSTIGAAASIASLTGVAEGTWLAPFLGPAAIAAPIIGMLADSLFGGKPSVGPNSDTAVGYSGGQYAITKSLADNGGDVSKSIAVAQQAVTSLNGIIASLGVTADNAAGGMLSLNEKTNTFSSTVGGQKKDFGSAEEAVAAFVADSLRGYLTDASADFSTTKSPQIAANLRRVLDADITAPAQQFLADIQLAGTDFANLFGDVAKAQPDQIATQIQALSQQFVSMRDAAGKLTLDVTGMADSFNSAADRVIDSAIRAAKGIGEFDTAQQIRATFTATATALLAAGQDASKAVQLYGAQMEALLVSIGDTAQSLDRLVALANSLRDSDPVAALWADTRAGQVRDKLLVDLQLRALAAQVDLGQVTQADYDATALRIAQTQELNGVQDEAYRAALQQTQALEAQAAAAKAAAEQNAALAEAQTRLVSAAGDLVSDLDKQRASGATGLTPQQRIAAVDSMVARDLALSRSTDADVATAALQRLKETRATAQDTYDAVYGKGSAESVGFAQRFQAQSYDLPAVKSWEQQVLDQLAALPANINVALDLKGRILELYEPAVLQKVDPAIREIIEKLVTLADGGYDFTALPADSQRTISEILSRVEGSTPVTVLDFTQVPVDARRTVIEALERAEGGQAVDRFTWSALPADAQRDLTEVLSRWQGDLLVDGLAFTSLPADDQRALAEILTRYDGNQAVTDLRYSQLPADAQRTISEILTRNQGNVIVPELQFSGVAPDANRAITEALSRWQGGLTVNEFDWSALPADDQRTLSEVLARYMGDVQVDQLAFSTLPADAQRQVAELLQRSLNGDAVTVWTPIALPASASRTVTEAVNQTVTKAVETTETVEISRSIDDKMSGILESIKASTAGMQTLLSRAVDGDGLMVRTRVTTDPRTWVAFEAGGPVSGYEDGGPVVNGVWGKDSVIARGPGGAPVWLAGGEWITPAPAVNDATMPVLEYIRQHRRLPPTLPGYESGGLVGAANLNSAGAQRVIVASAPAPAVAVAGGALGTSADVSRLERAFERLTGEVATLRRERREDAGRARQLSVEIASDQLDVAERQERHLRRAAGGGRTLI